MAKLPVLLNLCQCLAKSGGGRGENAGRAAEFAGQAIELDATVRKMSLRPLPPPQHQLYAAGTYEFRLERCMWNTRVWRDVLCVMRVHA